jgi:nifR3 family TIM-barrel protein
LVVTLSLYADIAYRVFSCFFLLKLTQWAVSIVMIRGFWNTITKPIFCLAPMVDVTDAAFRRIIAAHGKPDVVWTEFVSADGLCSVGRERLMHHLWFDQSERPIVAQFFTSRPEHMRAAAQLAVSLGFDGIDINMGCPDRGVEKQGAGAALIKNPALARDIILAAQEGAGDIPVSVKTRIGYFHDELSSWLPALLAAAPAAITLHARTRQELSDVPAHWDAISRAVRIRNEFDSSDSRTLILGNGDVSSLADARARVQETGADGVMIGRGIFGNPWFFSSSQRREDVSIPARLRVMLEHTRLFEELFSGLKNFDVMKKHYKAYVSGFPGAVELRVRLMAARNASEVERVLRDVDGCV